MRSSIKSLVVIMIITSAVGAGISYALPADHARACDAGTHRMGFESRHSAMDSDRMIRQMAATLNLTKEQRDAMYGIVDTARPQMRFFNDSLSENRKQWHALMQQRTPDEGDI